MGLAIIIVLPNGEEIDAMHVQYSSFAALRDVVRFNETPETTKLPGAKAFHDHSDCDGEWTTDELNEIAIYLDAILTDPKRKPQRDRKKIIKKMEAEETSQHAKFRTALAAARGAIYPSPSPLAPTDAVNEEEGEDDDEDEGESVDDGQGSPLLAIPPSLHFTKARDYDEWVKELAETFKDGAEKQGKAVFC
jgi:hypothetical protein